MEEKTLMWRETGRRVSLFNINAMATFPFIVWMMHMSWYTFIAAFLGMLFFIYLERKGYTFIVFLRWLRAGFVGKRRLARSLSKRRFFK